MLPRAKQWCPVPKGDGKRWLKKGSPEVAGTVVISPGDVMMIISTLREDGLEELAEVADHPWLELDRRKSRG